MFGFFNFHGTLIQGLGITEKQLVAFLEKKGLHRMNNSDKSDNFSYESDEYLVNYDALERYILLKRKDIESEEFLEFARVCFRSNGVAELETSERQHLQEFVSWLKSP